jgi:hypothetical protein
MLDKRSGYERYRLADMKDNGIAMHTGGFTRIQFPDRTSSPTDSPRAGSPRANGNLHAAGHCYNVAL